MAGNENVGGRVVTFEEHWQQSSIPWTDMTRKRNHEADANGDGLFKKYGGLQAGTSTKMAERNEKIPGKAKKPWCFLYGEPHEQEKDMDSEMRNLAFLLDQISTRPISKVRKMRCLTKEVLSPVLPSDPESSFARRSRSGSGSRGRGRPPRAPRCRGRGRSSGRSSLSSVIDPSPCSTFPDIETFPSFVCPFIENWKNVNGDGNCGYQVCGRLCVRG
ncbi:hypothetical protein M9H77_21741 [Catharanthus roseus]|uniref:Uncharacterized protein n=1 Tax=Catharanthus roseus TaxID=4058 RepID=A0ACC0AR42_CATRO|nr:hypothetical protein M9H77_21741 [Catharanthus roseus]